MEKWYIFKTLSSLGISSIFVYLAVNCLRLKTSKVTSDLGVHARFGRRKPTKPAITEFKDISAESQISWSLRWMWRTSIIKKYLGFGDIKRRTGQLLTVDNKIKNRNGCWRSTWMANTEKICLLTKKYSPSKKKFNKQNDRVYVRWSSEACELIWTGRKRSPPSVSRGLANKVRKRRPVTKNSF